LSYRSHAFSTGPKDLDIILQRLLLCGIRFLSKLLFVSEQPSLAIASTQPINPLSPFDSDPFDTHTGSTLETSTSFTKTRQFDHFSRVIHVLWKFGVQSRLLHTIRTYTKYLFIYFFAQFLRNFNFKLIAGENSEKHVFCRVTNRFAVNLILIRRLP
jgi:hypothetical protein